MERVCKKDEGLRESDKDKSWDKRIKGRIKNMNDMGWIEFVGLIWKWGEKGVKEGMEG